MGDMGNDGELTGLEVAVIGLALRVPGAGDVASFWDNLLQGVESISFFEAARLREEGVPEAVLADPTYVRANGVLEGVEWFDAGLFGFSPREAEVTDPQHRLFLECAWEALEDAGWDPATVGRPVGVYGGSGFNTYLPRHLLPAQARLADQSLSSLVIGNDKDYLATRVAYKLDLEGPAVVVQSACSTSLVAVHLACQGLLSGECDMALAGGVSVRLPQHTGYPFHPGGIMSPDGHCRAFDARAAGTVGGNGVGLVVLKRLADALADGDTIRAVIKGSALNNDGARKVGYTAPRIEGQAKVIRNALTAAGVAPETVGFVEAHGTGTPLGDPIEVAALREVFRDAPSRRRRCLLGSVKTNVGHLDAASGVVGLIKAVLTLEHARVPPTLHFEQPNLQSGLEQSPFEVNARPVDWPEEEGPRRAGVSSFGVGGTNVHVVLEEWRAPRQERPAHDWQVLVLSARSEEGLVRARERLAHALGSQPRLELADAAYTLAVGRRAFPHRQVFVCRDAAEARAALRGAGASPGGRGHAEGEPRQVFFLLPGQGSQYPGMGRELYAREPVFQQEVDRCAALLAPHLGEDLRPLLLGQEADETAAARLRGTRLTQPALFVIEWSLARLWESLGVRPSGLLGHSVGEWVAACLAGVFSLEDALGLVALRGRLMEERPAGEMLAVHAPEARVREWLGAGLELAALNAPELCVVTGPGARVGALREQLRRDGVSHRALHTSHAFHSAMMEPAVAPFVEAVARVRRQAPTRPFVSNVTGRWVTAEEACEPAYWGRQLRAPVLFSQGVRTLAGDARGVLLEVGPGRTLGEFARQHPELRSHPVFSSLRHPQDTRPEQAVFLTALGGLWAEGVAVSFARLYEGQRRRRVSLPTTPLERQRYWIDAPGGQAAPPPPRDAPSAPAHERPALATAFVAPANDTEQLIADVWKELLGLERVGSEDDFFQLGGHSLMGTQLAVRLRQIFGVEVPLPRLYEAPTVARLALLVESLIIEELENQGG